MASFPCLSDGVLISQLEDSIVVYDLVNETLHPMNPSAGAVLTCCDGCSDLDETVDDWARITGADRGTIAADVVATLAAFAERGLVGRSAGFRPPPPPTGSTMPAAPGAITGAVHRVIDHRITFRSRDRGLLDDIDTFLGAGATSDGDVNRGCESERVLVVDVEELSSGEVVLTAEDEEWYPDRDTFLEKVPMVLSDYATRTDTCVVFHAGAVRCPDGEVVLLPAPSGSGKSTLVGAFVGAGWDYLGDEAIGVRSGSLVAVGYPKRLSLDESSRRILGLPTSGSEHLSEQVDPDDLGAGGGRLTGDVAPVSRVLIPNRIDGAVPTRERLTIDDAVVALLANTFNLASTGGVGLDAICRLARTVPVERLVYGETDRGLMELAGQQPVP